MATKKRYTFKRILIASVWIVLSAGLIVLLVAAITKKNNELLKGIEIKIDGVQDHYFINKKDVMELMEKVNGKKLNKANVSSLDLAAMEAALQKNQWINKIEMFFDNNNMLQVKITEREPVARIFTVSGASFYMDSSLMRLPLSDKFSARLPVFSSFPSENKKWSKRDSLLGKEIKLLGDYIVHDPFWMAQIDQIDITPAGKYELIPKLGNQVIRFGGIENYKEKFNKLMAFYKKVQTRTGWNRYSVLDIQYKGQVVAVRRNSQEIKADSLRAIEVMKAIIEEAKAKINDSSQIQLPEKKDGGNSIIKQSREIDDAPLMSTNENTSMVVEKKVATNMVPVITVKQEPVKKSKPAMVKPKKTLTKKQAEIKEPIEKQQPKAVMPPKSDY